MKLFGHRVGPDVAIVRVSEDGSIKIYAMYSNAGGVIESRPLEAEEFNEAVQFSKPLDEVRHISVGLHAALGCAIQQTIEALK